MITFIDLIPGASMGIVKIIIGYPFDTIKTNVQTNTNISYYKEISTLVKNRNIFSLYRGCFMPLNTAFVKRGLQLAIFEDLNKNYSSFYAGLCSGTITSIISNPMNIVKVKMQTNNKQKYKNTFDCIKQIYNNDGLKGFNKGFTINIVRDSLFSSFFLGSYGYFRSYLKNYGYDNSISYSICGTISSITTWSILIPFDTVRTVIQTSEKNNKIEKLTELKKKPLLLWRGLTPMLIRAIPINIFNMVLYENIKNMIQK